MYEIKSMKFILKINASLFSLDVYIENSFIPHVSFVIFFIPYAQRDFDIPISRIIIQFLRTASIIHDLFNLENKIDPRSFRYLRSNNQRIKDCLS